MNKSSAQNFVHLLEDDIRNTSELIKQLEQEKSSLEQREIDSLQAITDAKNAVLAKLDTNRTAREELLASAGFPQTEEGFNSFISKAPKNIQQRWDLLKNQLAQCKDLNLLNAQLIHRGRTSVTRILDILKGQTSKPKLYNEQGNTKNGPADGHSLAKA